MRRLFFIAVLLGRFAGQEYVWRAARLPRVTPIERPLTTESGMATQPAWWFLT
jgi:hypothetical protein